MSALKAARTSGGILCDASVLISVSYREDGKHGGVRPADADSSIKCMLVHSSVGLERDAQRCPKNVGAADVSAAWISRAVVISEKIAASVTALSKIVLSVADLQDGEEERSH
ncbi:hypothetical protein [Mesorhizobium amorphae]|nr:hypothetical protein [Mesorhizobium amorphae]